jgi:hypothetical protein
MGEERGENHQRNDGGYRSEPALVLVVLPGPFLRGQKLPLGLRDLCCKALQKLPFLNPFVHLRTKFDRNIQGMCAFLFFPGEQSHFMKGTFLRTSAVGIATSFSCDIKGGLDKGSYFSNPLQSGHSPAVGHSLACHKISINTFLTLVNKKIMPARKTFWRRVRQAEKTRD